LKASNVYEFRGSEVPAVPPRTPVHEDGVKLRISVQADDAEELESRFNHLCEYLEKRFTQDIPDGVVVRGGSFTLGGDTPGWSTVDAQVRLAIVGRSAADTAKVVNSLAHEFMYRAKPETWPWVGNVQASGA
jgi:hypothetical protein